MNSKININGISLTDKAIETIHRFQEEDNLMATELIRLLDDYIAIRAWIGINQSEGTSINQGAKNTLINIQSAVELKSMINDIKI